MHFTASVAASILAFSAASAAPLAQRTTDNGPFTLMALRSGSAVHLSPINANGGGLWVGKDASTYCPQGCADSTEATVFVSNGGLSFDVIVPGGQQLYVAGSDELFHFTPPHSGYIPEGSTTTGFQYTPPAEDQAVGYLTLGDKGIYACPQQDGDKTFYAIAAQISSPLPSSCIPIALGAVPYNTTAPGQAPTWEYI